MELIRQAKADDYNALVNIFRSWSPKDWDLRYAARYYQDFFSERNHLSSDEVFVKVCEGEITGVIGFCADAYETDDILWLGWFYVHKKHLRMGHGRTLLKYAIGKSVKRSARSLYLDTASDRHYHPARKLYESMGFKIEATLKDYYGHSEDQIIYSKQL